MSQSILQELMVTHLYIRDFIGETCQRLNFTSFPLPILDNHQLSDLSDWETILVPLTCSALNALTSMKHHRDTITTQLGNIEAVVATLPTFPALESARSPIKASLRDLAHIVSAATPPHVPVHTSPPIPRTCTTTCAACPLAPPRAQASPPAQGKSSSSSLDQDILRYDPDTGIFYCDPCTYPAKFPHSWEAGAFREVRYPDPTTFISSLLVPDCPKPQPSYGQDASASAPKGKQNKSSLTAGKVTSASNVSPVSQTLKSLPRQKEGSTQPVSPPPNTHRPP